MKHQTVIINSIIIIIVVCALALFVFKTPYRRHTESFVDDPNLAPAEIAGINNVYCKRNLVFPNMNQNNFLASSRSLVSDIVSSNASCNLNASVNQINDSYSIVHENYMYYSLRTACMLLSFTNIKFESSGQVVLSMDRSSPQLAEQLGKFISLNPLFVEFSVGAGQTSIAYFPVYNPSYTSSFVERLDNFNSTQVSTTPFDIRFIPITNQKFFNYEQYGSQYGTLQKLITNPASRKTLNTSVYFLDYLEGSAHNIRYELPLSYDSKTGTNLIFNKDFETLASSPKVREYQFFKNVYMYHKYQVPPIFTFKFTISIPAKIPSLTWTRQPGFEANTSKNNKAFAQTIWPSLTSMPFDQSSAGAQTLMALIATRQVVSIEELSPVCQSIINNGGTVNPDVCVCNQTNISKPTTIARVYMGSQPRNAIGYYDKACWTDMNDGAAGDPINNVFSMVLAPKDCNTYHLIALTGVGNNCNNDINNNNNTFLELPYSSDSINVVLTVSPYEKILTAYWNVRNANRQMRLSRRRTCTSNNNFYKLFVAGERTDATKLDNMYMKYHTDFVKNTPWVKLGYVNIYNEIYA